MYKKDLCKEITLERKVEIENSLIEEAIMIKYKQENKILEEVVTRKFLGLDIETKFSISRKGAKIIERKRLTKEEIKKAIFHSLINPEYALM